MYQVIHDPNQVKEILSKIHVGVFNTVKTDIGAAANFAVGAGRQEAHVITGHMKANIQQEIVSDEEAKIYSKAIYSGYENKRGGNHAFFDKMVQRTRTQFPNMIMSDITHVIRSAKVT